ncbi:hypothetical protein ACLB2K_030289 [Fragaria x ananassa]
MVPLRRRICRMGFLERTQGAGLVTETWAPQVAVLSHPSVCGFVTHCGWNSVMESVVDGVAMVAWPLYAEQKMNARAFVEMGVAVWPEAGEDGVVGRGEVERVVRMVVEGEEGKEIRRRVREIQRSAVVARLAGVSVAWGWSGGMELMEVQVDGTASAADANLSTSKRENGRPAQKREEAGRKETCSGWLWRGRPLVDLELELLLEQALLAGLLVLSGGAHARG